jgi:antitoxin (DNA-binding transcriptional repressor) of toxin-antitoxin stability system
MLTIGIRELKARLSQVLRDVQGGETILVTDRGRVVAELRRPDASSWVVAPQERALARLAAEGHLRVAESPRVLYEVSPVTTPSGTARSILDEAREDP